MLVVRVELLRVFSFIGLLCLEHLEFKKLVLRRGEDTSCLRFVVHDGSRVFILVAVGVGHNDLRLRNQLLSTRCLLDHALSKVLILRESALGLEHLNLWKQDILVEHACVARIGAVVLVGATRPHLRNLILHRGQTLPELDDLPLG